MNDGASARACEHGAASTAGNGEQGAAGAAAGRPATSTQIVEMVRDHASELSHDQRGAGFVTFLTNEHRETWQLDSRGAREWIMTLYYRLFGKVPRAQSISDAVETLAAIAKIDGPERAVHLRTAQVNGKAYHDLVDSSWRAVSISADGWSVGRAEVLFRRSTAMRAIVEPERGGTVSDLIDALELPTPDARHVIVWLVAVILGDAPIPILELVGPAGAGKTTLLRRLRSMVDPSEASARATPRSVEDLYVGAHHSYILACDNLSHISPDVSDALCVICTGGGYGRRSLFTSMDEVIISVRRPIILTGVAPVITASDLLDRAIAITLEACSDGARRTEESLEADWRRALPKNIGAIYDLCVLVLRERAATVLASLPRMADFAVIGETISRICGWPSYAEQYAADRAELAARAVEASPVAYAVIEYLRANEYYSGPVGELAKRLERSRSSTDGWPKSPRGVGDALRRSAPGLEAVGIITEFPKKRRSDGYHVTIKRSSQWPI